MTDAKGRVALVTGGASGIGLGMARALTLAGAKVIVSDVDKAALAKLAGDSSAAALAVELDVTEPDSWDRVLDECERAVGGVDILCNNAGVSALGTPIEQLLIDYWERVFKVNVTAVLIGTQKVLARMRARGTTGHIITTASVAGIGIVSQGSAAYSCSKSAAVTLMEVLQREVAGEGIGVSVFCPGPVRTQLWRTSRKVLGLSELNEPPEAARRVGSASDAAMDALDAGRIAIAGMLRNQFYIFSHREPHAEIERRHLEITRAFEAGVPERTLKNEVAVRGTSTG